MTTDATRNRLLRSGDARLWGVLAILAGVTLVAAWIVLTDAFPWLRGPGAWPPSWRWLYVPIGFHAFVRLFIHALLLLAYGGTIMFVTQAQTRVRARMALLAAAGFIVVWQLAGSWVREPNLLDTLIFRTYAPSLNGYFLVPAQVDSIGVMLRHYVEAMPTFFGDKPQTHPPGLVLYYTVFQEIFVRLPGLTGWFAPLARGWANPGQDWIQLADPLITSAFVTTTIQTLLIGATPPAIYAFLGQMRAPAEGRSTALWAALLVPLLPALTMFFLQWDTLFPALGFAAWFFALRGQNRLAQVDIRGWGQWLDWLWAGFFLSTLTWLSFGTLVFGLMIGFHVLWREGMAFVENRNRFDPLLLLPMAGGLALMGLGVVVPWLFAYGLWGMNFFELMQAGLRAHYDIVTAHRDYATWVWMNIVDFVLWTGPAPILLGLASSGWLLTGAWRQSVWRDWTGLAAILWIVFLLLDLSGTTRGEIGRLWIFLMPFPLFFALILPWTRGQHLILMLILMVWCWVITYTIPPFLCC